jgi:Icc-related predicted phosphoesterase
MTDNVNCFFVTDLHGQTSKYEKLFEAIVRERPEIVLIGGDILPGMSQSRLEETATSSDFIQNYLAPKLSGIRAQLGEQYPVILVILGNDDPRCEEEGLLASSLGQLFRYIHGKHATVSSYRFYGYAYVPPTPFLLKDWERYDVSRYIPPGCVSPEEGHRTFAVPEQEVKWRTIKRDLEDLVGEEPLDRAIFLMHTPPYETPLDQAALEGVMYEHVPVDPHVGSIAVRRFIEERQPLMTLHGHVHESVRISGVWKMQIGQTVCVTAAHDGPELALVRFNPKAPDGASRELL